MTHPSDKTILIIDDDEDIVRTLTANLSLDGYRVCTAYTGRDGIDLAKETRPDLILLDLNLPDLDGIAICEILRREFNLPIIMLTARGDLTDRVVGLELGADDYMSKPFEPRELIARMRALLRRSEMADSASERAEKSLLISGSLELDRNGRWVRLEGQEINITAMEFDILERLMANQGIVLSRDRLTEMIHGEEFEPFNRTIDILISRIRHKLQDSAERPRFIRTVRGAGYMFIPEGKS